MDRVGGLNRPLIENSLSLWVGWGEGAKFRRNGLILIPWACSPTTTYVLISSALNPSPQPSRKREREKRRT